MNVWYEREAGRACACSLGEALGIWQMKRPGIIAFVGAGGKTSLIRRLAYEARERGLRTVVATTTHMARPERLGVFSSDLKELKDMLNRESIAVAGCLCPDGKISDFGPGYLEAAAEIGDLVLVEADGSRRLPLKVPAAHEPVIPENTRLAVAVSGISALGKPASQICFRLEQARAICPKAPSDWIIQGADMARLMEEGYLKPLSRQGLRTVPLISQADTPDCQEAAWKILDLLAAPLKLVSGGLLSDSSRELF